MQLSDFFINKSLGNGSYGQVYLGVCKKNGKAFALKAIPRVHHKSISREIECLEKLKGLKFISQCHGVIEERLTIWLVISYQRNGSLFDYMQNRSQNLSLRLSQMILTDVCLGLTYMHSKKLLHGDLKCENILLDSNLRAQIADFGLALKIENGNGYKGIWGTVDFQAPEQLSPNGKWDQRVDYFVAGIILVIMVTGQHPFGVSESEIASNTLALRYKTPDLPYTARSFIESTLCPMETRLNEKTILKHPFIEMLAADAEISYYEDTVIKKVEYDSNFYDDINFFEPLKLKEPTDPPTKNMSAQTNGGFCSTIDWDRLELNLHNLMSGRSMEKLDRTCSVGTQTSKLIESFDGEMTIISERPVIEYMVLFEQSDDAQTKTKPISVEQPMDDDDDDVDKTGMDLNGNSQYKRKSLEIGLIKLKSELKAFIKEKSLAKGSKLIWHNDFFYGRCVACSKYIKMKGTRRGKCQNPNWSIQPFKNHFKKHVPKCRNRFS